MAIRVLVADDSAFMRNALSMMLREDPEIEVVATAVNGLEAVEKTRRFKPDLITMDIEMPEMDGIAATRAIMAEQPTPVLVISAHTVEGARATLRALEAGAVDFLTKESNALTFDLNKLKTQLQQRVKMIVSGRSALIKANAVALPQRRPKTAVDPIITSRPLNRKFKKAPFPLVAVGVSTGGPFALQKVIAKLPEDLSVPIAIVQHMPPNFTDSLAKRLSQTTSLTVQEGAEGMPVKPGHIYLAPGGKQMVFVRKGHQIFLHITSQPSDVLFHPSVDVMFLSACEIFGGDILGVVMTGMGKDGLEGARKIKALGGTVYAQDEKSCVVYGMPRAIVEANLADKILPLKEIPDAIAAFAANYQIQV
jgi:two-component system chemotaxis response regulator CheB